VAQEGAVDKTADPRPFHQPFLAERYGGEDYPALPYPLLCNNPFGTLDPVGTFHKISLQSDDPPGLGKLAQFFLVVIARYRPCFQEGLPGLLVQHSALDFLHRQVAS